MQKIKMIFTLKDFSKLNIKKLNISFRIEKGNEIVTELNSKMVPITMDVIKINKGKYEISCLIKKIPLGSGYYTMNLFIRDGFHDDVYLKNINSFKIKDADFYDNEWAYSSHSPYFLNFNWLKKK